jgi:hypothetical protein
MAGEDQGIDRAGGGRVSASFLTSIALKQRTRIGTMNRKCGDSFLPLRHEVGERAGVRWRSGLMGKLSLSWFFPCTLKTACYCISVMTEITEIEKGII